MPIADKIIDILGKPVGLAELMARYGKDAVGIGANTVRPLLPAVTKAQSVRYNVQSPKAPCRKAQQSTSLEGLRIRCTTNSEAGKHVRCSVSPSTPGDLSAVKHRPAAEEVP
jgi:hypothetical protein